MSSKANHAKRSKRSHATHQRQADSFARKTKVKQTIKAAPKRTVLEKLNNIFKKKGDK